MDKMINLDVFETPEYDFNFGLDYSLDFLVEVAKTCATAIHAHQKDKAGKPYIDHLSRVVSLVGNNPDEIIVAWLHDSLEDASELEREILFDFIVKIFPRNIVDAILAITHFSRYTNKEYYEEVKKNPLALKVKLKDIEDNSNEERLSLLEKSVSDRLREKYRKAYKILNEEKTNEG